MFLFHLLIVLGIIEVGLIITWMVQCDRKIYD